MTKAAISALDGRFASRLAAGQSGRQAVSGASSLLLLPAVLVVCFCLLVPLAYVVVLSFNPPVTGEVELTSELTLVNYARLFLQPFYSAILLRTISVSAITTFLCVVFGLVLALSIWRAPPRQRGLRVIIVISPLLVSIVTRTYGWMVVLGDNGILNTLLRAVGLIDEPLHMMFTQGAVIVGLVHVFLPMMVLSILAAMDKIDPALAQAAETLGASAFVAFWKITFPLLIPGLTAGVTIVFSLAMSSYVTPALMGGRNAGMLTTLIYQQFVVTYNWHFGAALVVVLLTTSLIALALVLLESGRRTRAWLVQAMMARLYRGSFDALAGALYCFMLAPLVCVVLVSFNADAVQSFPPRALSLHWYWHALNEPSFVSGAITSAVLATVRDGFRDARRCRRGACASPFTLARQGGLGIVAARAAGGTRPRDRYRVAGHARRDGCARGAAAAPHRPRADRAALCGANDARQSGTARSGIDGSRRNARRQSGSPRSCTSFFRSSGPVLLQACCLASFSRSTMCRSRCSWSTRAP